MKAAVVPAVNGTWEVKEVPTPEPGANQVLMKICASGLCHTDVAITEGSIPTQFPRTLGHEPVGEIVAVSEGVRTRQVGDRECDPEQIAAIGYCFGGCGVLEMARSGLALEGVVSLHGELATPLPAQPGHIKAKILVLHGDADPRVNQNQVTHFLDEMRQVGSN